MWASSFHRNKPLKLLCNQINFVDNCEGVIALIAKLREWSLFHLSQAVLGSSETIAWKEALRKQIINRKVFAWRKHARGKTYLRLLSARLLFKSIGNKIELMCLLLSLRSEESSRRLPNAILASAMSLQFQRLTRSSERVNWLMTALRRLSKSNSNRRFKSSSFMFLCGSQRIFYGFSVVD